MPLHEIAYLIGCYLIGSIPFGYIIAFISGKKDIRKEGSGNIGATNVLRSRGTAAGLATLVLDVLKGFLPVAYGLSHLDFPLMGVLGGALVVTGHIFPLFLKFRGGKGVATYAGLLLAYSIPAMLVFLSAFILSVIITRYVSAGSISGVIISFFFILFSQIVEVSMIIFVISLLIIIRHRSNLKRVLSRTESKLNFGKNE